MRISESRSVRQCEEVSSNRYMKRYDRYITLHRKLNDITSGDPQVALIELILPFEAKNKPHGTSYLHPTV